MDIGNLLGFALQQSLGPTAIIYCLAAIGLNIHFGYTGLLNFGQAGFMLVAGYAFGGAVTIFATSLWAGVIVGILLCVALALLLGVDAGHHPLTRRRTQRAVHHQHIAAGGLSLPQADDDVGLLVALGDPDQEHRRGPQPQLFDT